MSLTNSRNLSCFCNVCGEGLSTCRSNYQCIIVVNPGHEYAEQSCMIKAVDPSDDWSFQCKFEQARCCNTSYCNSQFTESDKTTPNPPTDYKVIVGMSIFGAAMLSLLIFCLLILWRRRKSNNSDSVSDEENNCLPRQPNQRSSSYSRSGRVSSSYSGSECVSSSHSGSGRGKHVLRERTIGNLVQFDNIIGEGRYGKVYKAYYQGTWMAVKVFLSKDEENYEKERRLYMDIHLRHDNILAFRDCDMTSVNSVTQFLILTEYHPHGSLYDYMLENRPVKLNTAIRMLLSACSGLTYLHLDVKGSGHKPAIAHRDIKSKNILVKNDGTCCVADLGLSLMRPKPGSKELENIEVQVGTRRYAAPEIADSSINKATFESFLHADVYSFGLMIWEILINCSSVADYRLPYYDEAGVNPSFEAMATVISVQKFRPPLQFDPEIPCGVQAKLKQMMESSWKPLPSQRVSALRLQKYLLCVLSESSNIGLLSSGSL